MEYLNQLVVFSRTHCCHLDMYSKPRTAKHTLSGRAGCFPPQRLSKTRVEAGNIPPDRDTHNLLGVLGSPALPYHRNLDLPRIIELLLDLLGDLTRQK